MNLKSFCVVCLLAGLLSACQVQPIECGTKPEAVLTTQPDGTFDLAEALVASTRPGPGNTGPRIALTKWTEGNTVTKAQTITGKEITSQFDVRLPAGQVVTLNDCALNGDNAYYVLYVYSGSIVCNHCSFQNAQASASMGSGIVLNQCDLGNFKADAGHLASSVTINACYIHNYGQVLAAHGDGAQAVSGSHIVVSGNTFASARLAGGWTNSGVFLNGSGGAIIAPVITGNYFLGGSNYAIYLLGNQTGAVITNNVFYKDKFQFGVMDNPSNCHRPAVWSGNTDEYGNSMPLPAN